jgi:hypothetical protein
MLKGHTDSYIAKYAHILIRGIIKSMDKAIDHKSVNNQFVNKDTKFRIQFSMLIEIYS